MSMAKDRVRYCVVDAFTDIPFRGNPAAVCLLDDEKAEDVDWMQGVAAEINLFQTCFLTKLPADSVLRVRIRCFSPLSEVNVYAHALLAAAHTIFLYASAHMINIIELVARSGVVTAKKIPAPSNLQNQDTFFIELDYPVDPVIECDLDNETSHIFGALHGASIIDIKRTRYGNDLLVEVSSGENVALVLPQMDAIAKCPGRGIIVTGRTHPGSAFDFYSRYFCPKLGVNEDPVTGSVHCALASYWSKKLGKCDLSACQVSPRGGIVDMCIDEEKQRVLLRGKAVVVVEGRIMV
ncbi:Phenazine biosynthesis PhzF protein [Sesbania bispinosa]|nr:Phenazine biosynthesis PhzF protein [Sesbania bispinosa]